MARGRRAPRIAGRSARHSRGRLIRSQDGLTLIEVLVAIVLLSIALLTVAGTFDSSRRLTTFAERRETAAEVGERELERLLSQGYGALTTTAPSTGASPSDPTYYVMSTCPSASLTPPCYQWDQSGASTTANTESLVITAGAQSPGPVPWTAGSLSGSLYRFVTWVDDACSACPYTKDQQTTTDYRRVTVAVTIDGTGGPTKPILVSTIATSPVARAGQ
jgi:prepilin-type N-terminal cleavage/methylation domain-containing protein